LRRRNSNRIGKQGALRDGERDRQTGRSEGGEEGGGGGTKEKKKKTK
jgi:hypothetical protein